MRKFYGQLIKEPPNYVSTGLLLKHSCKFFDILPTEAGLCPLPLDVGRLVINLTKRVWK